LYAPAPIKSRLDARKEKKGERLRTELHLRIPLHFMVDETEKMDIYEDLDELFSSTRSVSECNLSYVEVSMIHPIKHTNTPILEHFELQYKLCVIVLNGYYQSQCSPSSTRDTQALSLSVGRSATEQSRVKASSPQ